MYAPQNGVVTMLMAREGMYVKISKEVMTLADLSSVWVLAEVFESQSAWVELNQSADVELSYIPGKTWKGKVDYIYPSLDARNRTLKVRLQFDNFDELLKPNMYANIIIYGGEKRNILSVPTEALIRSGSEERLIIAKGNGRFVQRVVKSGIESGDDIEIISGLNEEEKVVISAQFLIDSEASLKASLSRMSSSDINENTVKKLKSMTSIKAKGKITGLMLGNRKLIIQHGVIETLNWPEMEMNFKAKDNVFFNGLVVGDRVEFELEKMDDSYVISAIKKQGE